MRRRDGLRRRLRLSNEGRPVSRTEVVRPINLNQKLMDDTAPRLLEFLVDAGRLKMFRSSRCGGPTVSLTP